MRKWLVRVGRGLLAVTAILFWVETAYGTPGWVADRFHALAVAPVDVILRVMLGVLGFVLFLIVIGPARLKAWYQLFAQPQPPSWAPKVVKAPLGSVPRIAAPAALRPRYDQRPPYRHLSSTAATALVEHRIGINNPSGGQTARHVRVELVSITPEPRHVAQYPPVIPYGVPMVTGGDEHIGISLPPGREELWKLGYSATGTGGIVNVGGFAVADQRWRGLVWRFDLDERWRLSYRVVADNRPDVDFSLVMFAYNGAIRCELEG